VSNHFGDCHLGQFTGYDKTLPYRAITAVMQPESRTRIALHAATGNWIWQSIQSISYTSQFSYFTGMRDPSPTEIEFALLLFAWVVGFCWVAMRLIFALLGSRSIWIFCDLAAVYAKSRQRSSGAPNLAMGAGGLRFAAAFCPSFIA
jgi:hypothetical protein